MFWHLCLSFKSFIIDHTLDDEKAVKFSIDLGVSNIMLEGMLWR
jgi:hypothetical protein